MANVYEWLDAGNTLVGDGAMGTALQDLGAWLERIFK